MFGNVFGFDVYLGFEFVMFVFYFVECVVVFVGVDDENFGVVFLIV